jgi:hypothetical protein
MEGIKLRREESREGRRKKKRRRGEEEDDPADGATLPSYGGTYRRGYHVPLRSLLSPV